jgi:hypothetical protein
VCGPSGSATAGPGRHTHPLQGLTIVGLPSSQRPPRSALEQRLAREREQEREALRDSLTMQKGYVGLFAFGVVLTTWGGVIG